MCIINMFKPSKWFQIKCVFNVTDKSVSLKHWKYGVFWRDVRQKRKKEEDWSTAQSILSLFFLDTFTVSCEFIQEKTQLPVNRVYLFLLRQDKRNTRKWK